MCNEPKEKNEGYDYRFLDYRLDQLEQNLRNGQERLEHETRQSQQELLKMYKEKGVDKDDAAGTIRTKH